MPKKRIDGWYLKRARFKSGWTLQRAGKAVGVTGPTIRNWERNDTRPRVWKQAQLLQALAEAQFPNTVAWPESQFVTKEPLGMWLHRERVAIGLSQVEIAGVLGISPAAVSSIEGGAMRRPLSSLVDELRDLPTLRKQELESYGIALPPSEAGVSGPRFADLDPYRPKDVDGLEGLLVLWKLGHDIPALIHTNDAAAELKKQREAGQLLWFATLVVNCDEGTSTALEHAYTTSLGGMGAS